MRLGQSVENCIHCYKYEVIRPRVASLSPAFDHRPMPLRALMRETRLPFPAETVYAWHLRPGALERLLPPWSGVRVVHRSGTVAGGGEVELSVPAFGRRFRWLARHETVEQGRAFADVQIEGPFRSWRHTHRVHADGDGCILEDQVEFGPPGGRLGLALIAGRVERDLDRLVAWRRARLIDDLARHEAHAHCPRLRVGISGARGLIGSALAAFLESGGHTVIPFRRESGAGGIAWEPGRRVDEAGLQACDAIVHLAGANVAEARWTPAVKSRLWSSRVEATRHLCETLARLPVRPKVLICASGIGVYGLRRDDPVKEDSSAGDDFLAELCQAWEAACQPARDAGIRVVHARIGMVVAAAGGALAKMLPPARFGLLGPVAGGRQWVPWIALDDLIGAMQVLLHDEGIQGPVNLVSPEPVTNRDLVRAIGRVIARPTVIPVPALAVRLLFGEMGQATLLASCHALPGRLLAQGFPWRHRRLEDWLRFELG